MYVSLEGHGAGVKNVILIDKATLYLETVVIYHYTFENALGLPVM